MASPWSLVVTYKAPQGLVAQHTCRLLQVGLYKIVLLALMAPLLT
jgi:hypothetical protein